MGVLDDKVALITGGSRGIGAAIARRFAAEGAAVAINFSASAQAANDLVAAINGGGGRAVALAGSVADTATCQRLVDDTVTAFGRLDILVNNAGITRDRALNNISDEQWDEVLDVNLRGTFACTRAAYGVFRKQRSGVIINMSSAAGQAGNLGQANYVAAKAGIIGLTKASALEFARLGVTVNCICPGLIDTDMTAGLHDRVRQALLDRIPLGRPGTADDVARAALFLASEAPYMTGQTLDINGGLVM